MFSKIKAFYIFNVLAILIVSMSFVIYIDFKSTIKFINQTYHDTNIRYVKSFTQNLKKSILEKSDKNIFASLSHNHDALKELEESFKLFITEKYKYIYLLERYSADGLKYRFLLDGSKNEEDKSELGEIYEPLEIDKFNSVYTTKKSLSFTHKTIESLWMTFINPVVIDNKVIAVIVVDFSIYDYDTIYQSLGKFDTIFQVFMIFMIFIFAIMIWFAYMDRRREIEKDEAYHHLEIKSEALKEESVKVQNLNATLEERVKKELQINRQKDQKIIEQSRLAQMGEMISMIAHQWRQPLAAISSTSSALELKAKLGKVDKDMVAKHAKNIEKYSQHLSATIDDFRDFFKTSKEFKEVSFDEIIHSVLLIVEVPITTKNITFKKDLNSKDKFRTYPNELKQVVLNLIKNAEDILLEKKIRDALISIKTYSKNGTYTLEVSDNAGGVPTNIIDKIFDPYFSTKLDKNGTGLGLYMSKTIVEEHCHGVLDVENIENGALFRITFTEESARRKA